MGRFGLPTIGTWTPPPPQQTEGDYSRNKKEPKKFFQTTDFGKITKAKQRHTFFKEKQKAQNTQHWDPPPPFVEGDTQTNIALYTPWYGTTWCHTDRRDGTAELAQEGLTNAEAPFTGINTLDSCDHKRNRKRAKQRRHRYNKAVKAREQRTSERRQLKIKDKTVFYVPNKREKLKANNALKRREYRRFMRKMASDLSKKRGLAKLRKEICTTRERLLTSSGFKNKMRTLRRENKHKFREKWRHHKQTFMGITQQTYITKDKGRTKKTGTRKLPMYENMHAITANIRGINSCGKRQILAAKWEREKIDIALLTETQKNTGGMEKEGAWGKYTVFYSTGICPKKREEQEKHREEQASATRKKRRKKKGQTIPAPMSKAKPPHAPKKTEEGNHTKCSTASKRNADYEHAGVAIAVHKKWIHLVEEVREISGRTITVLLRTGSGGNCIHIHLCANRRQAR